MHLRTAFTAVGVAGLLLMSGNTVGEATTGHSLLLGTFNTAVGTTTLRSTGTGSALRLQSRPGVPPLAVGSSTKVPRLDSDLLDGKHASAFAPATTTLDLRLSVKDYSSVTYDATLPTLPAGQYLVTYSASLSGATGTAANPMRGEAYLVQGPGGDPGDQTLYSADQAELSSADDQYLAFSGSAVFDTTQNPKLRLEIELNNGVPRGVLWSTLPEEPIQITITRLDGYQRRNVTS